LVAGALSEATPPVTISKCVTPEGVAAIASDG
jgi:hypothetical protein